MELQSALSALVSDPEQVSVGASIRDHYGRDLSCSAPQSPDVVVFARSREDVSRVLMFADSHRLPVTPCGVRTSLEGHVIPVEGGVSLDLTQTNTQTRYRI